MSGIILGPQGTHRWDKNCEISENTMGYMKRAMHLQSMGLAQRRARGGFWVGGTSSQKGGRGNRPGPREEMNGSAKPGTEDAA